MITDKNCSTCKHFYQTEPNKELQRSKVCRRYPPHGQMVPIQTGVQITSFFPPTEPHFICGEWAPGNVLEVQ